MQAFCKARATHHRGISALQTQKGMIWISNMHNQRSSLLGIPFLIIIAYTSGTCAANWNRQCCRYAFWLTRLTGEGLPHRYPHHHQDADGEIVIKKTGSLGVFFFLFLAAALKLRFLVVLLVSTKLSSGFRVPPGAYAFRSSVSGASAPAKSTCYGRFSTSVLSMSWPLLPVRWSSLIEGT